MAADSHVGCASSIICDDVEMDCGPMRRDSTVIRLLGSCIVKWDRRWHVTMLSRASRVYQKQSKTAVSSCTGRVHVHVGYDSYDVRDVRGMLLGCLEQTKLMVPFAKHELSSDKNLCRVYWRKQLFSAIPAV